jgi:hypothetical protein
LRPATREARARNAVPFFGPYQSHWVLHTFTVASQLKCVTDVRADSVQ